MVWCETSKPDLHEARQFAEGVHAKHPGKLLAYNCSPSFNWKKHLDDATIARFQRELGAMGYKFQFVTLAGFHALNLAMFELARDYKTRGMSAYSELQQREFAAEGIGYTATRHQREVGTGYFDAVAQVISAAQRRRWRSPSRPKQPSSERFDATPAAPDNPRVNIDFHHGTTYVLARLAGFSQAEARTVAHASQYVDDAVSTGAVTFTNGAMYARISSAHENAPTIGISRPSPITSSGFRSTSYPATADSPPVRIRTGRSSGSSSAGRTATSPMI